MSGFFDRMLGRGKKVGSASTAKERLQFILVHDRIDLPPERLKAMKDEILAVISKYVAVSTQDVEIALEQRDRKGSMLVAEIPFSKSITPPNIADSNSDHEKITEDVDDNEGESILDKLEELEELEEKKKSTSDDSDDNDTKNEDDLSANSADSDDETSKPEKNNDNKNQDN